MVIPEYMDRKEGSKCWEKAHVHNLIHQCVSATHILGSLLDIEISVASVSLYNLSVETI